MPTTDISNSDDTIDSRDVIMRISELRDEIDAEDPAGDESPSDEKEDHEPMLVTCGECGKTWDDARVTGRTPTPSGRCPFEYVHDEIRELKTLEALEYEAEGYSDWAHGATLIRDSYFEQYAQQYAQDIGAIDPNASWPLSCIDWDQAARELQMDYTSVDFDGADYWVR